MAHKDICIRFALGDQEFEVVGFLEEDDSVASYDEVVSLVDNGCLVTDSKDREFVLGRLAGVPVSLKRYDITVELTQEDLIFIRYGYGRWNSMKGSGNGAWTSDDLVLRKVKERG